MNIIPFKDEYTEKWNDYLQKNEKATIFNTIEWKNVVQKVYQFKPLYFLALDDGGRVKGVLGSFLTKGIFGTKIVSAPLNFYSQPLFDDHETGKNLIEHILSTGKKENVEYVELKSLEKFEPTLISQTGMKESEHYLISNLTLEHDPEKKYYSRLVQNLRTMKRNAQRENIKIRELESEDDLKRFYDILVRLYRDKHHMIPQPYALFFHMYKILGRNFQLLIAERDNELIAGMVLLLFKKQVVYLYGASDQNFKRFSPGTLLIDEVIRTKKESGYKNLDFGITSQAHEKLLDYKLNWGAESSKLPYYYFLIKAKEMPRLDYFDSYKNLRRYFKYIPIPLIKSMSSLIVKRLC